MDFPTLVYRCPGEHFAHGGKTYSYAQALSEEHLEQLVAYGWRMSLVEAVDGDKTTQEDHSEDDGAPTRDELEKMAADLGIKFDGRTGDASLLRKIEESVAGKA